VTISAQELEVGQIAGTPRDVVYLVARLVALNAKTAIARPDFGFDFLRQRALRRRVSTDQQERRACPERLEDIRISNPAVADHSPPVPHGVGLGAARLAAEEAVVARVEFDAAVRAMVRLEARTDFWVGIHNLILGGHIREAQALLRGPCLLTSVR